VVGLRGCVRPFAPFITAIQIAQMAAGLAVTGTVAYHHSQDPNSCATDAANWKLALGMYGSYLFLFVVLFLNLYCTKGRGHRKDKEDVRGVVELLCAELGES
jgi:elongation of very long chain fatty acids protein 6